MNPHFFSSSSPDERMDEKQISGLARKNAYLDRNTFERKRKKIPPVKLLHHFSCH